MGNSSSVFDENSSSVLKQEINSLRTKIERMESELLFLRQKVDLYEKEKFSYERFKESYKNIRFILHFQVQRYWNTVLIF